MTLKDKIFYILVFFALCLIIIGAIYNTVLPMYSAAILMIVVSFFHARTK